MAASHAVTWRQRIVLVLAASVLTLAALEGAARLAARILGDSARRGVQFQAEDVWEHHRNPFHEPDPELLWRPIAGYDSGQIRLNSHGCRGPEFSPRKPPGSLRVALLGNSVTFGYGVAEEETYAARLREELGRAAPAGGGAARQVEVINAGVLGYTSWQGLRCYTKTVRAFAPDLVIAMFGYNDHHLALETDAEKGRRGAAGTALRHFRRSGVFRLAHLLLGGDAPQLRRAPRPRVSLAEFRDHILSLRDQAAADGAASLFLTVALRPDLPLVESFYPIDFADGRVWMRQIDFALGSLPRAAGGALFDHFFKNASLEPFVHDAQACAAVQEMTGQFPDLPIFHYLAAACLRAAGEPEAAAREARLSRQLDAERQMLEDYNDVLRRLAEEGAIELLDLATHLAGGPADELFIDVVHPSPRGHQRIAEAIAARIAADAAPRARR